MKFLLYGFFALLLSPLFSYSIEPKNPVDACERFLNEKEKAACLKKTQGPSIDWYASSLCEKIDDDKIFLTCFDSIQNARYEPKAIELCDRLGTDDDTIKLRCLQAVKNKVIGSCHEQSLLGNLQNCLKRQRVPASEKSFFQK